MILKSLNQPLRGGWKRFNAPHNQFTHIEYDNLVINATAHPQINLSNNNISTIDPEVFTGLF